jgi:hypothetical protein
VMSLLIGPIERWAPDLTASFHACEAQVEIRHPASLAERIQHGMRIERRWRCS